MTESSDDVDSGSERPESPMFRFPLPGLYTLFLTTHRAPHECLATFTSAGWGTAEGGGCGPGAWPSSMGRLWQSFTASLLSCPWQLLFSTEVLHCLLCLSSLLSSPFNGHVSQSWGAVPKWQLAQHSPQPGEGCVVLLLNLLRRTLP